MPEETATYTVRVTLQGEDEPREFVGAIEWSILDGIAKVVHEDRVYVWPLNVVREWDVPALEEDGNAPPPTQASSPQTDEWFSV